MDVRKDTPLPPLQGSDSKEARRAGPVDFVKSGIDNLWGRVQT